MSTAVRIVVDFRSALRARTGVGQTVFHVVRALAEREALSRRTGGAHSVAATCPSGACESTQQTLDITLFSSSWKDRPAAEDLAQLPGMRMVDWRVPVRALNFLWHRLEWPPVELLAGRGFDIAYSPHPLLMPARRAAQVVTIHDLDFLAHPERTAAEIRRDYPALVREHAHRAAHVIVSSHYTARQVQSELGLPADRMSVCHLGAPDWSPPPGRQANRSARHVLFMGMLEERKNVGTLLAAYADLIGRRPGVPPLVLAGPARAEAAPWLESITRPPLADHVRYLGYVSDEQKRALFESAALFVFPSLHEGFGMPVVEAMSAGVPVVVSNRGALPEIVQDAGVVVEPDDAEALAGAMERLLSDEAFAAASAAKVIQRARHFRWANTASCVVQAFERALENRGW